MTSYVISHTQCPACAKIGNDTSKDNLVTYSDGGEHCFCCGYHKNGNSLTAYVRRGILEEPPKVVLPEDIELSYPSQALDWLRQYEITHNVLVTNKVMWSGERQLLVFPYYHNHQLKAWQGRYFGTNKNHPKWITYGKIQDFEYYLGQPTNICILVEDIISAIKLSKCQQTLPLFGSFINSRKLLALRKHCSHIVFWLDPDKQKESIQFLQTASLFFEKVSVILADKDPKDFTYNQIGEIFDAKSIDNYFKTSP